MAVFGLGAIGLASVALLPIRAFFSVRRAWKSRTRSRLRFCLFLLFTAAAVAVIWIEVDLATDLLRCLNGQRCGPNVASGGLIAASLGLWYMAFEIVQGLLSKTGNVLDQRPA